MDNVHKHEDYSFRPLISHRGVEAPTVSSGQSLDYRPTKLRATCVRGDLRVA